MPCCKTFDKQGIRTGGVAAKPVVEVGDDKILVSRFQQEVKKGYGIRPSRDGDKELFSPREARKLGSNFRDQEIRFCESLVS